MAIAQQQQGPNTVGEICLLGWMPRDSAIQHLTTEAVDPTLDAQQAGEAWDEYHRRVQDLPERAAGAPAHLQLTPDETREAQAFLRRHQQAQNISDVVKVDPLQLVAHQMLLITDQADAYTAAATTPESKMSFCLGGHQQAYQLAVQPVPFGVRVPVPHAEFAFNFDANAGGFQIQQLAAHISVTAFDNRMLLFAGYHRSFALSALHNADAIERSLLVVVTTDGDFMLSPASPNQVVRDMVRSLRPPLFADFFDERLAMRLRVRKRSCELWIQGQIKWVDG